MNTQGLHTDDDLATYDYHIRTDSTTSQQKIENYLKKILNDRTDTKLLHVGFGNSKFAKIFPTIYIDGITVVRKEYKAAIELQNIKYKVFLIDKHKKEILNLKNKYDYIIDNNLISYAPTFDHVFSLLDDYGKLLKGGGKILTEKGALKYLYQTSKSLPLTVFLLKCLAYPYKVKKVDRGLIELSLCSHTPFIRGFKSFRKKITLHLFNFLFKHRTIRKFYIRTVRSIT